MKVSNRQAIALNLRWVPSPVKTLIKSHPSLFRSATSSINWVCYQAWPRVVLWTLLGRKLVLRRLDRRADDETLMINIGAGNFFRRHWRVMDHVSPEYNYGNLVIDYAQDLTSGKPFPLADNSVLCFFSSHTLEHIPNEHCDRILSEIHRCLKPGGAVRLTMPDFDLAADAFRANRESFFMKYPGSCIEERFLDYFATYLKGRVPPQKVRADFGAMRAEEFADLYTSQVPRDIHFQMAGNHINWWNYAKLSGMLRRVGFTEVYRSTPQGSRFEQMRGTAGSVPGVDLSRVLGFDGSHPELSLYVEAVKRPG